MDEMVWQAVGDAHWQLLDQGGGIVASVLHEPTYWQWWAVSDTNCYRMVGGAELTREKAMAAAALAVQL